MHKLIYKMREKVIFITMSITFFQYRNCCPIVTQKTDSFRSYLALRINVILGKWIDVNVSIDDVKGWEQ
jgi:hypothetical protein